MSRYLSLFVSEAGEHLAAIGQGLVRLEQAGRAGEEPGALVDEMFRHAHSVKGMAAAMQLDGISSLAHKTEDLFDALRKRRQPADGATVDVLLAAADALQAMVSGAATGGASACDADLAERLAAAAGRVRAGAAASGAGALAGDAASAPGEPGGHGAQADRAPPADATALAHLYEVEVEVSGGCPVPAVRAFLVVKKLGGLGAVLRSSPSVEDLRSGRLPDRRIQVLFETGEPAAAVERALGQVSDLARVTVRDTGPSGARTRAAPAAPTSPDGERAAPPAPAAAAESARTVRVRTELLDYFLDAVGELILATARLRQLGRGVPPPHRAPLDEGVDRLHAIVKDLHDKVMSVRMTPIALVTDRLPRAARDLARKVGKQVEVEVRGAEIEIDRAVIQDLGDPLLHVLRNSVDHGIEAPHLRLLAGKPATGLITVSARRERDRVILEIGDDGKGMSAEKLRAAAVARGELTEAEAVALGDREAWLLACLPGVSTADQVTDVSGRGVGLDAVKRAVEATGGTLEIESAPGQGTRFTFRLPLTVAVQPVLLVRVGEEVLGLPVAKVHGAAQVELERLDRSQGSPVLSYDGGLVPVHDLSRVLGLPAGGGSTLRSVVVAEAEGGRLGLAVDALLGQEDAVLKPLAEPLDRVQGLSAVTVLGNGRPVFILDVPRLVAA